MGVSNVLRGISAQSLQEATGIQAIIRSITISLNIKKNLRMQRTESTEAASSFHTASERLQRIFWHSRGMQGKVFQSMSSTAGLVVLVNAYRSNCNQKSTR